MLDPMQLDEEANLAKRGLHKPLLTLQDVTGDTKVSDVLRALEEQMASKYSVLEHLRLALVDPPPASDESSACEAREACEAAHYHNDADLAKLHGRQRSHRVHLA